MKATFISTKIATFNCLRSYWIRSELKDITD